ncbi:MULTISPECIES: hypothetical protein [Sphaerochaeta]|jgi:hypothetical protein|uniref:YD repeat-containing protein n=2 Tax=root TaxID=1 RepID=A0ABY4D8C4_9SPIR|nr:MULTISPECIES: hypothetical protein [Sphaerochaeta]MDT3359574.1 hypothetical protein [Spirochaetota bacterium]MDD2394749.1 hypothetical protein [Sphaerochaeta sp.]MDD3456238.1 hypothetical protein [Sphaerochaeta sp.]MDD4039007.1 hypothetical protein [Sphaerochaeta sp.]MDX9985391.1 hypothetical protein [Sphaerochaeta sp.]
MLAYDYRIQTNLPFDYYRIYSIPNKPELTDYTRLLWYGYDEEGPTIYRQNPQTGQVVRIDYTTTPDKDK